MSSGGRRDFLGTLAALFKEQPKAPVRPPYTPTDVTFEACRTCEGMCVKACEEKIIDRDSAGIVFLDFKNSGCSNCTKCLDACTPNVLQDPTRFIQAHAKITSLSCMSHHDTICFSCKEPCLENAIHFQGMFRPIIIPEKCTGCGYCISVCPSGAIEMFA